MLIVTIFEILIMGGKSKGKSHSKFERDKERRNVYENDDFIYNTPEIVRSFQKILTLRFTGSDRLLNLSFLRPNIASEFCIKKAMSFLRITRKPSSGIVGPLACVIPLHSQIWVLCMPEVTVLKKIWIRRFTGTNRRP